MIHSQRMAKRTDSKKIKRKQDPTGALTALNKLETKLARKKPGMSYGIRVRPSTRKLISFKARF